MMDGGGRFFDSDEAKIHYWDVGRGRPVVLLHGALIDAASNWSPLLENVAGPLRLIAPDLRGHGRSSSSFRPGFYGGRLYQDALRLMDHLGLATADVVGYSMGGRLALKLAATHANRLRSVLVAGAGWTSPEESANRPDFAAAFERCASVAEVVDPEGKGPAPIRAALDRHDPRAAVALARGDWSQVQVTRREVEGLSLPLQVLVGGLDPAVAEAERLAKLAPNACLKVIEGHDHLSVLSTPEFVEAICDFLN